MPYRIGGSPSKLINCGSPIQTGPFGCLKDGVGSAACNEDGSRASRPRSSPRHVGLRATGWRFARARRDYLQPDSNVAGAPQKFGFQSDIRMLYPNAKSSWLPLPPPPAARHLCSRCAKCLFMFSVKEKRCQITKLPQVVRARRRGKSVNYLLSLCL